MAYLGKEFTFDREENVEELIKATGVEYLKNKPNQVVEKNGDIYKVILKGIDYEFTYKSGESFAETIGPFESKTTITVDGDTFTQVQDFGSNGTLITKREYTANQMKVTYTSSKWDGVAYRYFKAL